MDIDNDSQRMRIDLKLLINIIYNYVDGMHNLKILEDSAKNIDKKYFPDTYAGDEDMSELGVKKRTK